MLIKNIKMGITLLAGFLFLCVILIANRIPLVRKLVPITWR
jgi:hypothetical protein